MGVRTIFKALIAFATALTFPSSVNGTIFRCPGSERCGLFGFFVLMHAGTPGTDSCEEYCVFFLDATLQCGSCSMNTAEAPTPSPINSSPRAPTSPINGEYDFSFSLVGVPTADQSLFTNAAQRWESVVVGDLPSVLRSRLRFSLPTGCTVPVTIDDLHICGLYSSIDGPLKVLGSAGPYDLRSNNALSITGVMEFDSADISYLKSQGNFESVILHEMGHILGT